MPIYDGEGMKLLLLGSCGPNKITQIHRPLGVQYTPATDFPSPTPFPPQPDPTQTGHPVPDTLTPARTSTSRVYTMLLVCATILCSRGFVAFRMT